MLILMLQHVSSSPERMQWKANWRKSWNAYRHRALLSLSSFQGGSTHWSCFESQWNHKDKLCGDNKVTVNQFSKLEEYPLPQVDDLLTWAASCRGEIKRMWPDKYTQRIIQVPSPSVWNCIQSHHFPEDNVHFIARDATSSLVFRWHFNYSGFATRTLTAADNHLDTEGVAIVSAVKRFYQYLYGHVFKIHTDNKTTDESV